MLSHAQRFLFFLGFVSLSCGAAPEGEDVLVGVSEEVKRPAQISVESQPASQAACGDLVFSEGAWQLSRAQAKLLRQHPSRLGATASLHSLGVKLDAVESGSLAACVGLRAGDVLAFVGAVSLMSPLEALPKLEVTLSLSSAWTLRYWRGASLRKVKLRVIEQESPPPR